MSDQDISNSHRQHFPFLKELEILPVWQEAARRFLKAPGITMIIGGPDSGKSTLSKYLLYRAYGAGKPAALVDADLGQSHLGPPATLGLGFFPPLFPGDDTLFPQGLYFIGQTSPVGSLLEVAVGCRILADRARQEGLAHIVVNTCGFVQGTAALRLKEAKLELFRPQLLLALENDGELQPLLSALGGEPLVMPVSFRASRKSPEERRRYRQERWRGYFRQARPLTLPGEAVHFLPGPLPPLLSFEAGTQWQGFSLAFLPYRLTGLLDKGHNTLALGLMLPTLSDRDEISLLTPLPSSQRHHLRFLKPGKLRLWPDGREFCPVTPS